MDQLVVEELSEFLSSLTFGEIPYAVVEKAKMCIMDIIACSFAGFEYKESQIALKFAKALGARGKATIWVDGMKTAPTEAAFCNCLSAHNINYDDFFLDVGGHPGSVVVPTALAVAEQNDLSGSDIITAIVCGYECYGRVGAINIDWKGLRQGFRRGGIFGPLGSAAAAAKLLRLNEQQFANAIAIACNCSAGLDEYINWGSMDLFFQDAWASRNGIMSAIFAKSGATGPVSIFEGSYGFCKAFTGTKDNASMIINGLREEFQITKARFKPAPGCSLIQTPIQVTLSLVKKYEIRPSRVKKVKVKIYSKGKTRAIKGLFASPIQAQNSIPFSVSSIILNKRVSINTYKFDYKNPKILELAGKVEVEIDPMAEEAWPERQACEIEVTMKDGSVYRNSQDDLHLIKKSDIIEKLKTHALNILDKEEIHKMVKTIDNLEDINASNLTSLCIKHPHVTRA